MRTAPDDGRVLGSFMMRRGEAEKSLPVRMRMDTILVEYFVAAGRGVASVLRASPPVKVGMATLWITAPQ